MCIFEPAPCPERQILLNVDIRLIVTASKSEFFSRISELHPSAFHHGRQDPERVFSVFCYGTVWATGHSWARKVGTNSHRLALNLKAYDRFMIT